MPSVACAGIESGSTIRQNTFSREARSSSAASSISGGMARKYCVISSTPNGKASLGAINAM
jgi:hypothetical protein